MMVRKVIFARAMWTASTACLSSLTSVFCYGKQLKTGTSIADNDLYTFFNPLPK
jgi:hypothetical protein